MKNNLTSVFGLLVAIGAGVYFPATSQAAPVVYTIDSTQSSITLSGNAFFLPYQAQQPGSLTDFWGGTIAADLTGNTLTFSGGSNIVANLHPLSPFSTVPYPSVPAGDNYGVYGAGTIPLPYGNVVVNGAYRSLSLDILTGTATDTLAPSSMSLQFTGSSKLEWGATTDAGPTGGVSSLAGVSGTNSTPSLVSLTPTTLTLPVKFQTPGSNRLEVWQGTIVATLVPEPSSVVLGGLCGIGLLVRMRRRK